MARLLNGAALLLLAAGPAGPVLAACAPLPAIRLQRFQEDYGALADPACRTTLETRLKHIPLGRQSASYLSLGGEARTRVEITRNPEFGLAEAGDEAILQRLLLHADLHLGDHVRTFVQIGSFPAWRRIGTGPVDRNDLDLTQAFADLRLGDAALGVTLRAGRQEVALGASRLISVRESPNIRRSYDGGRLMLHAGAARAEAFYLQPVLLDRAAFNDRTDPGQRVYGLYGSLPRLLGPAAGLDWYWIGYQRRAARFAGQRDREQRHSLGLRLFGEADGLDWDIEPVVQLGRFGSDRIRAWTVAGNIGLRRRLAGLDTRLGLKADIASGDARPGDGRLGTFNALYPRLPYFTEAGLAVPANIMDLHPGITLMPGAGVEVNFGVNLLWRHRRADAIYIPPAPATPLPGSAGGGRFIGAQWEASLEWELRRGLEARLFLVHFTPGAGVSGLGGRPSDFLATSIAAKF